MWWLGVLVSLGGLAGIGGVRVRGDCAVRGRGRRQAEVGPVGQVVLRERLVWSGV